jgi:hypothetical protein
MRFLTRAQRSAIFALLGLLFPLVFNAIITLWKYPAALVISCVVLIFATFTYIKNRQSVTQSPLIEALEKRVGPSEQLSAMDKMIKDAEEVDDYEALGNLRLYNFDISSRSPAPSRFIRFPYYVIYAILSVGILGALLFFVIKFAGTFHEFWTLILRHNFLISLIFVLIFLQFTLRRQVYSKLTWKKLSDPWLKWSGVSAISVGGFGFIATNQASVDKYLKITTHFVDLKSYTQLYIILILLLGVSNLLLLIGKSHSGNEETNQPKYWFLPTFTLIWTCNLGVYTFFFDCILLTFHANVVS